MLPAQPEALALLLALIFFVAFAYSSVGHGGASGYLAVLSFFGFAPAAMAPSALLLNLLVAGIAFLSYWRAGHFMWRLLWPFLIASVPCALLGGMLGVSSRIYMILLGAVLLFSAFRLMVFSPGAQEESFAKPPSLAVALPVGAGIGLLSGMVGIGGGIFLSPLVILLGWADTKRTAAAAAAFIWINSVAGLCGHLTHTAVDWSVMLWLVGAAFAGGVLGATLGARRFRGVWLRRILAVVLLFAVVKLLCTAL
jgi:hypothetical protein